MDKPVTIDYADGRKANFGSYDDAVAAIEAEYEDAEIGHDGDLQSGGDVTRCWADEESSINDPGVNAVASIFGGLNSANTQRTERQALHLRRKYNR